MAKKDNSNNLNKSRIGSWVSSIQNSIDGIYKQTFISTNNNQKNLNIIKGEIDDSIDSIINNNINSVGVPNISQLYGRMTDSRGGDGLKDIDDVFNDKALTDSVMLNFAEALSIKDYDDEIDVICKYMPTLEDALDAKKDNVLSADQFSKDFLNVLNTSNVKQDVTFNERIKHLKQKYNLLDLCEHMYDNASRYGESYVYIVPYKRALEKLLNNKANTAGQYVNHESAHLVNNGIIHEKVTLDEFLKEDKTFSKDEVSGISVNLEFNVTGVIESALNQYTTANKIITENNQRFDVTIKDDNIDFEGLKSGKKSVMSDGLIDVEKTKNNKIETPGCIVKRLKRENLTPLYIEDICLGYYYLESEVNKVLTGGAMGDPTLSLKSGKMNALEDEQKQESILRHISSKLSTMIDSKFINANQDLSKEIYMILRHNDLFNTKQVTQLKVTFIPPTDIIPLMFKQDPNTHRGISDLDKALLPAKLYTSLYTNGYLGIMTRGHDKRVYYVKQTIDTNISQLLLNTINQIKKGNFGSREISGSVKQLFNITGRFNDYIIPVGASGDAPINFEVMQGQNIDIKQELLEIFEQMAINSTDVPYEYIQSRKNVDYAVRLTMSNGKFLRKTYKRQAVCEGPFGRIFTILYNSEFEESDTLEVELPPPAFLNLLNTNTMIQNINESVASILEMEMADEEDEMIRNIFAKKLKRHYLGGYLDLKNIETIKQQSLMEAAVKKEEKKLKDNQM